LNQARFERDDPIMSTQRTQITVPVGDHDSRRKRYHWPMMAKIRGLEESRHWLHGT
jgi:hypothetical protein